MWFVVGTIAGAWMMKIGERRVYDLECGHLTDCRCKHDVGAFVWCDLCQAASVIVSAPDTEEGKHARNT